MRSLMLPNFRTLRQVAAFINANPKLGLRAEVERGFASTDRKIRGTRLRHPGKGRWGSRIKVYDENGALLLDHNNAETYRRTEEVAEWLQTHLKRKGA